MARHHLSLIVLSLVIAAALAGLPIASTLSPEAVLAQSSPSARPKPSSKFEDLKKRAEWNWQAHLYEEAASLYRQAVDLKPTWSEGWLHLSDCLYQLQRYGEARDAAREATIFTPDSAASWAYLGLSEYELRDYRRSFDDLSKAEKLGTDSDRDLTAQVKYHLAILWETGGQYEMGLREMLWFTRQNLGSPEILEEIGLCVLRVPAFPYQIQENQHDLLQRAGAASFAANVQKMDLARKLYEQLAANYPRQPNVHFAYGQFLSHSDLDAALQEYNKEIELNPEHVPALTEAAFLYLNMGQFDKVVSFAQEVAKLQPKNPAGHNLMGRALVEMGRVSEAIPELALATELDPDNSSFHLNLARAYQKAGEAAQASQEIAISDELERKKAAQHPAQPAPN
jgi:tetratricopeptide (TPR) repeat protein